MKFLLATFIAALLAIVWAAFRPQDKSAFALEPKTTLSDPLPAKPRFTTPDLSRESLPPEPTAHATPVAVLDAGGPPEATTSPEPHETYPEGPLLGRHRKLKELQTKLRELEGHLLTDKFESGDDTEVDSLRPRDLRDSQGRPLPNAIRFGQTGVQVALLRYDEHPEPCEVFWKISTLKEEIEALERGE